MVVSEGSRISEVKVVLELVEVSQRGSLEEQGGRFACACVQLWGPDSKLYGVLGLWHALLVVSGMLTDRN